MRYPEHEKMKTLATEHEGARAFMEWMEEQGFFLARYVDGHNFPVLVNLTPTQIIAKYLGVDTARLEAEKRQMLEALRTTEERAEPCRT